MADPIRQDTTLLFWSYDTAALHFGISRKTVVRYVREGLPSYFADRFVKPAEFIAEYLRREGRRRESLTRSQEP
jgi:hypothetical protein